MYVASFCLCLSGHSWMLQVLMMRYNEYFGEVVCEPNIQRKKTQKGKTASDNAAETDAYRSDRVLAFD